MPLYEYKCPFCSNYEEILEPLNALNYHDCHSCGASNAMQKQYSVPVIYESNESSKPNIRPNSYCKGRSCDCPYAK